MNQAYAKATLEKLEYPIALYQQFCQQYELPIIPPTNEKLLYQLERYLIYRLKFAKGTSGTVVSDIDALQRWFATLGIHCKARCHKPIRAIFNAAKRLFPSKNQTTRPLRLWEIQKILKLLNLSNYNDLVLYTVWCFAYTTGLRAHEYLAKSNSKKIPSDRKLLYLRRDRIYINNDHRHWGIAWYWYSKNNQTKKRQEVTLPCFCHQGICAVHALELLLARMPNKRPNAAIFTWSDGSYVTSNQTAKALTKACITIGTDPSHASNHSWRKSCITQAISQKMPDSLVVQLADWKSFMSCRPYINLSPIDLIAVREKYARGYDQIFAEAFYDQRFRNLTSFNKYCNK